MKWFKSFSDGRGGFNTFEWSLGDAATYGIINFLIMVVIMLSLLSVLPIILLLIIPFCSSANIRITSVICIILSTLFLIDYSIGGIFWSALHINPDMISFHKKFATFHAALILLYVALFFNAKSISEEVNFHFWNGILFIVLMFLLTRILFYPVVQKTVYGLYSKTKYQSEEIKK